MIPRKNPHRITDSTRDRFICLYTNCSGGWIDFEFIYNEKILHLQFTHAWAHADGPFQYVEWLEKMYLGSDEIYIHDAEDYQMELSYKNGVFKAQKTHSDEKGLFEIEIDRETLCRELYTSFVYFTESPLYKEELSDEDYDNGNFEGYFDTEVPLTEARSKVLDSRNWPMYKKNKVEIFPCPDGYLFDEQRQSKPTKEMAEWYKEYRDFADGKNSKSFDWKAWHERGIVLAKHFLMTLPADCELWYSPPSKDNSGLLGKETLLYLLREEIYKNSPIGFEFESYGKWPLLFRKCKKMLGLRHEQNKEFINFFRIIQDEARKQGCVFFLESEDGDHIEEFGEYDCDSLWGWLVPNNLVSEFSAIHSRTSGMTGIDEKWFVFWVFVDWEKVDGVPAVRFTNEYNWWENVEEKEMDHDEKMLPEWIWCLVGNIKKSHKFGENHEIVYGTKKFSGGTKVYCFPANWGDGYENIIVIGKPRFQHKLVKTITKSAYIENFRLKQVFNKRVIKEMYREGFSGWDNSDKSKETIMQLADSLNGDKAKNQENRKTTEIRTLDSKRFGNFYRFVQVVAGSLGMRFFVHGRTGKHIGSFSIFDCDTLQGWLIPRKYLEDFMKVYEKHSVGEEWNEYLCFAEWEEDGSLPRIWFRRMVQGCAENCVQETF